MTLRLDRASRFASVCLALAALGPLALGHPSPAAAQPPGGRDDSLLTTARFETPYGGLTVRLPGGLVAGDTLSGTVVAEPTGKTDRERAHNLGQLEGLVVDTGGERQAVGKGRLRWALPAAATALDLALRDPSGKVVGRQAVPVAPASPAGTDGGFELPSCGQAGNPNRIVGPFDGSFDSTEITLGGRPIELLAESPRGVVFASPVEQIGPAELVVREGEDTHVAPYRNVAVRLSAPEARLDRGERTVMTVEVAGLSGLREPLPLTLANQTVSTVSLEGGARQQWEIDPSGVGADGVYQAERTLTGLSPGPFHITAQVPLAGPVGQAADQDECKHWVVDGERIEWGPWNERADGSRWREGKIFRRSRCADAGSTETKEEEVGKAREEQAEKNGPIVQTRRYPAAGGGSRVVRETTKGGKTQSKTEVEYDKDGKPTKVTETDGKGTSTTTSYDNGEPKGVTRIKGDKLEEWKQESDGKWYKKVTKKVNGQDVESWVEDPNPPSPGSLPTLQ